MRVTQVTVLPTRREADVNAPGTAPRDVALPRAQPAQLLTQPPLGRPADQESGAAGRQLPKASLTTVPPSLGHCSKVGFCYTFLFNL